MKLLLATLTVIGLMLGTSGACASERMEDGAKAYAKNCAECHDNGMFGAPVTGRPADWEDRSHLWEAVLFEHARMGYLKMPAKGGNAEMTDYSVEAAAEYMLTITHPDMPED